MAPSHSPDRPRDPDIDRLLSRALSGTQSRNLPWSGAPDSGCVDAETLAAWVDKGLQEGTAAQVEVHLSSCAHCQAVLATLVRTEPLPAAVESLWARWKLAWLVPALGTATAVALYVASRPPAPPVLEAVQSSVEQPAAPVAAPAPPVAETAPPAQAPATADPQTSPAVSNEARLRSGTNEVSRADRVAGAAASAKAAPARESTAADNSDRREQEQTFAPQPAPSAPSPRAFGADATPAPPAPAAPAPPAAARPGAAAGGALSARTFTAVAPLEVRLASGIERWRVAADGTAERSDDSGATWQPVPAAVSAGVRAGSAPAPGVCWLVGGGGAVWVATDGLRFRRLSFPSSLDLTAIVATDARSATVTASDGRTFRTTDQGASWRP